ncbi:MAG: diacylglycerol kinase (ATP) [Chlamydiales bacterium]|jgi:diacylglycerol kinase (ATP)
MPYASALVVANPIAGRGAGRARAQALTDALRAAGIDATLFLTGARGDAQQRVADLHGSAGAVPEVVVVVGGDGTVGEVLGGLPPEIPLAVHAMGTANVLSLDLRLPRTVAGTVAMLQSGRLQGIDVAHVNGRLSFLVVGVGFDGAAVREVERLRRGPITKWNYVGAVLRVLRTWRAPRLSVEIDGRAIPGTYGWIVVSNLIGYGGILQLWKERKLDDGLYEVFLFEKATRLALVRYALAGFLGRLPGRSCRMLQARQVRIQSEVPVPYQVDGDQGGETPIDLQISSERFKLVVPA